jgi:hypothetical protein
MHEARAHSTHTGTQLKVNVGHAAGRNVGEQHHRLFGAGVRALLQPQQRRYGQQIGQCVAHGGGGDAYRTI